MPTTLTLTLPKPHAAQRQVIAEASRWNVVACGRRFGKSTLGIDRCATPDVLNYPVAWLSPTYKMLLEVWREAARILDPIIARRNVQERRLELVTGGLLEFWSLDKPDVARGRKYRRVVIDEAAMVKNLMDAWNLVIRPTLADYQGDAWLLSTPKGRNGFWQMFQWGLDPEQPEWACWQMPTGANPHIHPDEVEAMRRALPEHAFQQEIMAQFLEDAGGVFRRVMDAATAVELETGQPGAAYVIGVDWGKHNDFTVLTVLDARSRSMVYLDRFNQIDYAVQVGRLKALVERFPPLAIIAEVNSMGEPLAEQLQREGLPIYPFLTSNASKTQAIESLSLAFERGDIRILADPVLISELQAYEMERLPSHLLRYGAPAGMHDDTVMSLALAWQAVAVEPRDGIVVHEEHAPISPY